MRFYLSYFKLRFISGLQYRFAAIAGILTQFFFGIVIIMVYLAFYDSNATAPMTIAETVTYLWLNQCFYSLLSLEYKDNEIVNMIKKGEIVYELTRPKNVYFMWFFKVVGQRLSMATLKSIPFVIVLLILPYPYKLLPPSSLPAFLLFMISIFVGIFLMASVITFFNVIVLKTMDEKGITTIFGALADLFSGGFVPIPFFPGFLQKIADFLPFKYVSDVPFRIYSGNISLHDGLYGILIQLLWCVILITIGYLSTKRLLKRVVVQGG